MKELQNAGSNTRKRLSAKFSFWDKAVSALFIFVVVFMVSASMGITAAMYSFMGIAGIIAFAIILFWCCYRLSVFIYKDRKIIEFDETFLYLINIKNGTETPIRLENITWLNRRPNNLKIGAYWYIVYSLHYRDEFHEEQKIKFYFYWSAHGLVKFVDLVTSKNPEFVFKNWSASFDFKD